MISRLIIRVIELLLKPLKPLIIYLVVKPVSKIIAPLVRRFKFGTFLLILVSLIAAYVIGHPVVRWMLASMPQGILVDTITMFAVAAGPILILVSVIAMFFIYQERKISGHIQCRMGPMRVGGWHGWSQSLADGIKLMGKEDLVPADADGFLFRLAPYVAFVSVFIAFICIPFSHNWIVRDLNVGLLFILAALSLEVMGVILAGWASNNKWSVYGAMREACQMVCYEVPLGLALLVPIVLAGTLSMTGLTAHQYAGGHADAGWLWHWNAFHNPFAFMAFVIYYLASIAQCKRAPFDLPESESELVAGFHTEYSGLRFSFFFFAEYAAMFIVSAVAVVTFLGGWHSGIPVLLPEKVTLGSTLGVIELGPVWFTLKCFFFIYVQIWLRWTLPRLRIDQVLDCCVKYLIPLSCVALLGNVIWVLAIADTSPTAQWVIQIILTLLIVGGLTLTFLTAILPLYGRKQPAQNFNQLAG